MDIKHITIHPIKEDGSLDNTVGVFPKTCIEDICEQDGITPVELQRKISTSSGYLTFVNNSLGINFNAIKKDIITAMYPLGSVYMSFQNINNPNEVLDPDSSLGLTLQWELIKDTFLYASEYPGIEGGSNNAEVISHNHIFTGTTTATEPSGGHTHTVGMWLNDTSGHNYIDDSGAGGGYRQDNTSEIWIDPVPDHKHQFTPKGTISTTGVSGLGKNMPKFITVKVWKRV